MAKKPKFQFQFSTVSNCILRIMAKKWGGSYSSWLMLFVCLFFHFWSNWAHLCICRYKCVLVSSTQVSNPLPSSLTPILLLSLRTLSIYSSEPKYVRMSAYAPKLKKWKVLYFRKLLRLEKIKCLFGFKTNIMLISHYKLDF